LRLAKGDLLAEGDVVLSKRLKTAVIVHLGLDLGGLPGRDALAELLAAEKPLQDEIGAPLGGLAWKGLEELFAEGAASQAVNGLHLLEDAVSFLEQGVKGFVHGDILYHYRYIMQSQKNR
jgi:hypothetical protein